MGGPVVACDEGWIWVLGGNASLSCRQANVEIRLTGGSVDLLRIALNPMLKRVSASLS